MLSEVYPKTVRLKDGRSVVFRPFTRNDSEQLQAFLGTLPDEDRLFLRHDIRNPATVQRWMEELEHGHIIPLLAMNGEEVVGIGRLYVTDHGWMRHVGHMRLITAQTHRHQGLGNLLAGELVALGAEHNLEKIQAHVIEDNVGAVRMCQALGFQTAAVLEGMVKDQSGKSRNLAIMVNDISNLTRILEDWIQDSMLPAYRVPGGGA
ncbi:MAG: GNAT family N-acetyltransferase [Phycisphaerae bacterium]|nr:GNAT family N-acetyltransferase [Phycisphaerae bacterium]